MAAIGSWGGRQPPIDPPLQGWTARWVPLDKQYSYTHLESGYTQWGPPSAQKIAELSRPIIPRSPHIVPKVRMPTVPYPIEQAESSYSQAPPLIDLSLKKTGADILSFFDSVQGHWSGRGQHVEFTRNEKLPFREGASLGRGASADVHEVICLDIRIARKQIYFGRRMKIEDVRRELDILKKLNHRHVVTLLGSYMQSKVLGILLYPAAVCDLGVFLDEVDEAQRSGNEEVVLGLLKQLESQSVPLRFPLTTLNRACVRLKSAYGCIARAVQYLHDNDIRHKDLKPRNILLDCNDGLFITDFGISRDNTDASTSVTNGIERGTYKYCAPEIARLEPRGRAADVYALGCVFLEIDTVYRGLSLVEFDTFRTEDGDYSFQNSPAKLEEWMRRLREIPKNRDPPTGIFDILDIVKIMLSELPAHRPVIASVVESLKFLGGLTGSYFSSCCRHGDNELTEMEKLIIKYKKVKEFYFEKSAQVEQLQNEIANSRDGSSQQKPEI